MKLEPDQPEQPYMNPYKIDTAKPVLGGVITVNVSKVQQMQEGYETRIASQVDTINRLQVQNSNLKAEYADLHNTKDDLAKALDAAIAERSQLRQRVSDAEGKTAGMLRDLREVVDSKAELAKLGRLKDDRITSQEAELVRLRGRLEAMDQELTAELAKTRKLLTMNAQQVEELGELNQRFDALKAAFDARKDATTGDAQTIIADVTWDRRIPNQSEPDPAEVLNPADLASVEPKSLHLRGEQFPGGM